MYVDYLIIQGKTEETIKGYRYDTRIMLEYFKRKGKKIAKATIQDLYQFLAYLKLERGITTITIGRYISSIRSYFTYLYELGKIKSNPSDKLHKSKTRQNESVYLNLEEAILLLSNTQKRSKRHSRRNYAMITLFLNLGIRLAELVKMDFEDINWETRQIKIHGKGKKERILYLNNSCINAIINYTDRRRGAVFLSERGGRISRRDVQHIVKTELEAVGLEEYSTHKLRHTCATLMYQNGVDIRLLQKILGHESIATTEIYTHVKNEQIEKAAKKVGKLYAKLQK